MSSLDIEALAGTSALDENGAAVRLGSLWEGRDRPLVLVWLRHYG
jgi:hypothetical protein